jgi:hypothetical protein
MSRRASGRVESQQLLHQRQRVQAELFALASVPALGHAVDEALDGGVGTQHAVEARIASFHAAHASRQRTGKVARDRTGDGPRRELKGPRHRHRETVPSVACRDRLAVKLQLKGVQPAERLHGKRLRNRPTN